MYIKMYSMRVYVYIITCSVRVHMHVIIYDVKVYVYTITCDVGVHEHIYMRCGSTRIYYDVWCESAHICYEM